MNLKSVIALLMGLVIQLSQARMPVVAESVKTCATPALRMDCCEGVKSCPCAKQTEREDKPAPLIPAAVDLKLFVSKATGSSSIEALYFPPADRVFFNTSRPESKNGYAGVPLSVAFCSFVI